MGIFGRAKFKAVNEQARKDQDALNMAEILRNTRGSFQEAFEKAAAEGKISIATRNEFRQRIKQQSLDKALDTSKVRHFGSNIEGADRNSAILRAERSFDFNVQAKALVDQMKVELDQALDPEKGSKFDLRQQKQAFFQSLRGGTPTRTGR